MAGTGGIEPPHDDTKNRCLTAWLRPNLLQSKIPQINIKCYNFCQLNNKLIINYASSVTTAASNFGLLSDERSFTTLSSST